MNLGEILDAIGVELQHSPSSSTVRLERARIVAQEYLSLLGERRWTWTQQLADLVFYPKVTWSGSLTFAFRKLTFPSSVVGSWWVGHTVTITVGGTSFDGVVEATSGGTIVWLRDSTGLNTTSDASLVLVPDRVRLPLDATDLLEVVSRNDNRGPLRVIDDAQEGGLLASNVYGTPHTLVIEAPAETDYRPLSTLSASAGSGGSWQSAYAGTYRFFFVLEGHGRVSARSNTVSVSVSANQKITFSGLGDWSAAADRRGTVRALYVERDGSGTFWRMQTVAGDQGDTLEVTTASWSQETPWVEQSPVRYVRPYPILTSEAASTSNTSLTVQLRYQRRIPPIEHELDVPMLPSEHHKVLVFRAALRIAGTQGETVHITRLTKLEREATARLVSRYANDGAKRYVRGPATPQAMVVWGTPSLGS